MTEAEQKYVDHTLSVADAAKINAAFGSDAVSAGFVLEATRINGKLYVDIGTGPIQVGAL